MTFINRICHVDMFIIENILKMISLFGNSAQLRQESRKIFLIRL